MSADSIFNVIFTLYLGSFTWLLLIIKKSSESQVNLIKEQIAQKDATIEYMSQVNKKLQEDHDPVKWKARIDLNSETADEEIARLKQQKGSESQKKVLALLKVKKLTTELLTKEQQLTEVQNQYNNSIAISGSANLEALRAVTKSISESLMSEEQRKKLRAFGIDV